MAKISCELIKKDYPAAIPMKNRKQFGQCYCVGGALCIALYRNAEFRLEMNSELHHRLRDAMVTSTSVFPRCSTVAFALLFANDELHYSLASRYAENIVTLNDNDEIEKAYDELCNALNYKKETTA